MTSSFNTTVTQVGRFEPSYAQRQLCERMQSPEALFPATFNSNGWRNCHVDNHKILLLQTDGACSDNGAYGARAGAAYIYGPPNMLNGDNGTTELPLTPRDATSNRAELSGVIFALWHCNWHNTFDKIVVATDSEYVVKGCTEWANEWARRGWRTASHAPVKNQDLWEQLLARIEWLQGRNCQVLFWKIPREWNSRADAAAKRAAARADVGCV